MVSKEESIVRESSLAFSSLSIKANTFKCIDQIGSFILNGLLEWIHIFVDGRGLIQGRLEIIGADRPLNPAEKFQFGP